MTVEALAWLRGQLAEAEQTARAAGHGGEDRWRQTVLALVPQLRAILDACEESLEQEGSHDWVLEPGRDAEFDLARWIVNRLVSAHSHMPGYRPEWTKPRPGA